MKDTLESIREQNYSDYELICVNSSKDASTSDLLKSYDLKELTTPFSTAHLKARYLANQASSGTCALMLDATRPLQPRALETLMNKYSKFGVVCVREGTIGRGFWERQASYLKTLMTVDQTQIIHHVNSLIIARFFRREVLNQAFSNLRSEIPVELFDRISYGEHHLITEAAFNLDGKIILTTETLLEHFEDNSLGKILGKYHLYGVSQKILAELEQNYDAKKMRSHSRRLGTRALHLRFKALPITLARTIPFLIGLYIK